jgi:hypothetical protein
MYHYLLDEGLPRWSDVHQSQIRIPNGPVADSSVSRCASVTEERSRMLFQARCNCRMNQSIVFIPILLFE